MADIADDLSDDVAEGNKSTNRSHKGAMLVIIVGVLVMILAPVASWLVVRSTINPKRPTLPPKERADLGQPILFNVGTIVVNVAGTRMTRVLSMQPHLVLSEQRLSEHMSEIKPMLTDRVMMIASRRTLEQLETLEDREALKRDISNEINAMIRDRFSGTVLDVVFAEFLIQ